MLGVSRDADEDEIKQAYRKKAAEYHPDVSDDPDADEKFKKVKKAKEVLSDDEKRRAYDQMGHDRFEQAEKRGGFDGNRASAGGGNPFGGGGGMGGMGDIFEQFFGGGGGGGRNPNRPRQGSNLRTGVEIDLEDAFDGVTKQVTVRRPERCGTCDGKGHPAGTDVQTCPECQGQGQVTQVQQTPFGRVQQSRTCPRCEGEGQLYEETCDDCGGDGVVHRQAKLQVDIPAGIADGQTLQMEGEGAPGENGGPNGDLLIEIRIRDHPDFEREGADLYYRKPISFPQAVFGDEIEITTFDGSVEMDVPSGTQSGETFRLRGKGMPHLRRRGNGDLYVKVQVVTPESLNDEQKEALEAFAEAGGESVNVGKGFFERIKNSF